MSWQLRDPAEWPFRHDSPWNLPLPATATVDTNPQLADPAFPMWINAERYSMPIVEARPSDPLTDLLLPNGKVLRIRIPVDAAPSGGTDGHLHILDGRQLHEMWRARPSGSGWSCGHYALIDLASQGIENPPGGVRAYGGSAVAGLIRSWELEAGEIGHALAVALANGQLRPGPVWPASGQDWDATSAYTGSIPMGSLTAIDPAVDLGALGLDPVTLSVARAWQDFGGYVVDRTGRETCLFAEQSADPAAIRQLRAGLPKLKPYLRVVTNNGPERTSLALQRRRPLAPRLP